MEHSMNGNQATANVISMTEMKMKSEIGQKEKVINDYLGVLSFSELIDETSEMVHELNNNPFSSDIAFRSKLVLGELGGRLGNQSQEYTRPFNQMKKNLEKRILEIQGLI